MKAMRPGLIVILSIFAGVLCPAVAHAEVMRCINVAGKTLYTDAACPAGMQVASLLSLPESCATGRCEHRREREFNDANDRLRAEKKRLAEYAAERQQREQEYHWLAEARLEAELRQAQVAQARADEIVYAAHPLVGFPGRCGKYCGAPIRPRPHAVGNVERKHHGSKDPGRRVDVRQAALEPHRGLNRSAVTRDK
jgi:hypothetical protein